MQHTVMFPGEGFSTGNIAFAGSRRVTCVSTMLAFSTRMAREWGRTYPKRLYGCFALVLLHLIRVCLEGTRKRQSKAW
eukprot:765159-Hanusia_phi.AAC.1